MNNKIILIIKIMTKLQVIFAKKNISKKMWSNTKAMIVCDHNFIWMCFCLILSTNSFL